MKTKRVEKTKKRKSKSTLVKRDRGVVYFSHVPHGFYEDEMRQFFTQFGKVTNINIPRSSRTGKYKGYAFIEFLYPEVAKVVAETMNNYLMFQKVLKAKYIPPEDQKPKCFKIKKDEVPLLVRRRKSHRDRSNRKLSDTECLKETSILQKKLNKKRDKLRSYGVNYEFQSSFQSKETINLKSEGGTDKRNFRSLRKERSELEYTGVPIEYGRSQKFEHTANTTVGIAPLFCNCNCKQNRGANTEQAADNFSDDCGRLNVVAIRKRISSVRCSYAATNRVNSTPDFETSDWRLQKPFCEPSANGLFNTIDHSLILTREMGIRNSPSASIFNYSTLPGSNDSFKQLLDHSSHVQESRMGSNLKNFTNFIISANGTPAVTDGSRYPGKNKVIVTTDSPSPSVKSSTTEKLKIGLGSSLAGKSLSNESKTTCQPLITNFKNLPPQDEIDSTIPKSERPPSTTPNPQDLTNSKSGQHSSTNPNPESTTNLKSKSSSTTISNSHSSTEIPRSSRNITKTTETSRSLPKKRRVINKRQQLTPSPHRSRIPEHQQSVATTFPCCKNTPEKESPCSDIDPSAVICRRNRSMKSKALEYNLHQMFPDMSALILAKKKEWDYKNPQIIRALYVESETNLLSQWKEKHMRVKQSTGPRMKNNWSSRLRMSYLQYKEYKTRKDTKRFDGLTKHNRLMPDFPPVQTQNTLTSEYRFELARNRPPIPHHYLEYFQDHKKLPFKIVQIKRNCRAKEPD